MGLFGKNKKKIEPEKNEDAVQAESESDEEYTDDDTEELTLELDDSPVDELGDDVLKSIQSEAEAPPEEEEKEDDDDIFGGDLMDIFSDNDDGGLDLEALTEYLEDVDIESLLAQAQHVSKRLRGL